MAAPIRYDDPDIRNRVNAYAVVQMLKHQMPVTLLDRFALQTTMPRNNTNTAIFRRAKPAQASLTPLQEGVTPIESRAGFEDVTVVMRQYGQVYPLTDEAELLGEATLGKTIYETAGEGQALTLELLRWGQLKAGTNVFYANGTQRSAVNTKISLKLLRRAVRSLMAQKATKLTKILSGSVKEGTSPIEASYIGVCHTDVIADIRDLTGFVPVAKYGTMGMMHPNEVGAVEDIRFCASPELNPILSAGAAGGVNVLESDGHKADIYPVLIFGEQSYGNVAIRGARAMTPIVVPVSTPDSADPLGQRGSVGWKLWFGFRILNDPWFARLEVATSDLM